MGKNQKNHQNVLEMTPNFGQNESGRSMVEMLGVLAIIGVLSVGAISGYRYAMNKYRANQVTNELNLLSHQVAIAMMSKNGVTELKLDEPYETNKKLTSAGYNFEFGCGDGTTPDCGSKYYFNVQDVSEGVCKELVQMSEHMQFLKTRTDTCSAGNNALNFVFELPDGMSGGASGETSSDTFDESDLPTEAKRVCVNGGSWGSCGGGCDCPSGYTGPECQCDSSKPYWNGSACVTDSDCPDEADDVLGTCAKTCTKESDCTGAGEYCFLQYASGCGDDEEFSGGKVGTCRNAKADAAKVGGHVVSRFGMTWWSANRFCKALGKNGLASASALGCNPSAWECTNAELNQTFVSAGIDVGWTADLYGNSCGAYIAIFNNSSIGSNARDNNNFAICE